MVNRQLRTDLLVKLNISPQALSQRGKRLKNRYGPMLTEEAVYVIAHMEGIDITKYLPLAVVDRVRSLVPREQIVYSGKLEQSEKAKRKKETKLMPYPLVSISTTNHATILGTEVFPLLFQLENSIRSLIEKVLSRSGKDWWQKRVPIGVQNNVQKTMNKEKRYPYRDKRGNYPLYYANFDDLKKIIIDPTNMADFSAIIINFNWFEVKMDEVYMARNNLAHFVPLTNDDISRILLFHRDWARILDTAGIK
jgi:hypothetical protein